ncbi:ATP-dependent helicase [Anaerotignum sp.]|uniref:ATP-dependent helicase n=1 Tax=Anaerotignum sp. TaxID=2039241 RepID=UPI000337B1A9|nr:ATP-dependent helicase [Anaerotignum sp.]MCI6058214.1 ATP-dependent helicase [Clostridia bacterium]MDY3595141.1 ATP-dependent helicase [Anaerotignum sp.]CDD61682.1 uvrD/REP helicase [Clostridium sp. CAG:505]
MAKTLHPNQIHAISHGTGPMLVLAGPGSGKTTVIIQRIRRLTEKMGVSPYRILVITFTKAAAEQMKTRYAALQGKTGVMFGTFHSIFFRILRQACGYSLEQVLSEDERRNTMQKLVTEARISVQDQEEYIQQFFSQYSLMKNQLQDVSDFMPEGLPKDEFVALTKKFDGWKRRNEKIDFDDMLTECYEVLSQDEKTRKMWQDRFDYILVDEFQDVNRAQYACLQMLAAPKNNLFVVGDDDQSIYGFRGASPSFMLDFPKDFPGTEKVFLDVNYRCSGRIIRLASQVIGTNMSRYEKNIKGDRDLGERINVFVAKDSGEEAELTAQKIARLLEEGMPIEEIAVIFRTNIQGGAFARALFRRGIPYHLRDGGFHLYDHWIARDLAAYLFLAENRDSDASLLRIVNKPKRYISKDLLAEAEQMPYGLLRSLHVCPSLQKWQAEHLESLEEDLRQIQKRKPYEALRYVRKVVGYDEYLSDYAAYRKASLSNMIEIADEITETAKGTESGTEFVRKMEELSRQMKEQSKQKGNTHGVTLTTFHGAKGLEFGAVFLPSLAEGIIPYEKGRKGSALEEERRLFYVGLTRTKDRLFLSFTENRYEKPLKPSRFLMEMGLDERLFFKENRRKF